MQSDTLRVNNNPRLALFSDETGDALIEYKKDMRICILE